MKNPFSLFVRSKRPSEPARHAKRTWKKRAPQLSFSKTMLALVLLFLFIPLFVIIFYSFNESKDSEFTRVSLVWYEELFLNSEDLWSALFNSLIIAISSSAN